LRRGGFFSRPAFFCRAFSSLCFTGFSRFREAPKVEAITRVVAIAVRTFLRAYGVTGGQ
jgi:hypothetical protein